MIGFFDIYRAGTKIALDLCSGESFIPLSRSFDIAKIEKAFELCKRMNISIGKSSYLWCRDRRNKL